MESELLDAAWEELVELGYARLTMDSVAARAKTGVAVLYRRWSNKEELVLSAIKNHRDRTPMEVPDTGTLRGDLLAALTIMGERRATFMVVAMSAAFTGLLSNANLSPLELRDRIIGEQRVNVVRAIYKRAHDRGELSLDRVPPDVLALPFDLVRHDLLMYLKPLTQKRIRSIVDDVFLPLVKVDGGS